MHTHMLRSETAKVELNRLFKVQMSGHFVNFGFISDEIAILNFTLG